MPRVNMHCRDHKWEISKSAKFSSKSLCLNRHVCTTVLVVFNGYKMPNGWAIKSLVFITIKRQREHVGTCLPGKASINRWPCIRGFNAEDAP